MANFDIMFRDVAMIGTVLIVLIMFFYSMVAGLSLASFTRLFLGKEGLDSRLAYHLMRISYMLDSKWKQWVRIKLLSHLTLMRWTWIKSVAINRIFFISLWHRMLTGKRWRVWCLSTINCSIQNAPVVTKLYNYWCVIIDVCECVVWNFFRHIRYG